MPSKQSEPTAGASSVPEHRRKHGQCPCCLRTCNLTFHHLIPKKLHRRAHFRKHFDKDQLNEGVALCRQCHNGLHQRFDEMALAKHYCSLDRILADEELQRFFNWVGKQKVNSKGGDK